MYSLKFKEVINPDADNLTGWLHDWQTILKRDIYIAIYWYSPLKRRSNAWQPHKKVILSFFQCLTHMPLLPFSLHLLYLLNGVPYIMDKLVMPLPVTFV